MSYLFIIILCHSISSYQKMKDQLRGSGKLIDSSEEEQERKPLESRLKCESTFAISHICINPECKINAFHCVEYFCPCCSGLHSQCRSTTLSVIKELLEARINQEKRIMGKMQEIGKKKFEQIWQAEAEGAELYCQGFQKKYADILRKIYSSKKLFNLDGSTAESLLSYLKSSVSIDPVCEQELLIQFQEEVSKLAVSVMELKRKMMLRYKQLKMKHQNLKTVLQLKAALTAKACAILKESTLVDKNNEELMLFLYTALNKPLQTELIFRASKNNYLAAKFHQICDGIPNTFTIIRTEYNRTIAGYTPLPWNSTPSGTHAHDPTCETFLLSLDHRLKMPLIKPEYAIYCYTGFGPRFGGGADIHISDLCDENRDSYVNFPSSFMCPEMNERNQQVTTMFCGAIKGNSFRVKEYEVYRVYF